jgi:hypothetical protein
MTFESQPKQLLSKKDQLEIRKAFVLQQLADLDANDVDSLKTKHVQLESEILLVKEQLAGYFPDGVTKEEYDPTEFSPEDQIIINRLLTKKEKLIKERKAVTSLLSGGRDEMQSELLDQLTDIKIKLRDL